MKLSGLLFVLSLTILDVAISAPLENEKIEPVELYHQCFSVKGKEGDNNKSPVLLIHGLGSSHVDWNGVYEVIALGTGRRVCSIDLRNHGDSPWNNQYNIETMVVDVVHFLDQKNIQKINVVGHSLGGKVAVHLALNHPDRVDSVVVEDMRPNGVNDIGLAAVKGTLKLLLEAIKVVPEGLSEDETKAAIIKYVRDRTGEVGIDEEENEESRSHILAMRLVNGKWQYKTNIELFLKAYENLEEFFTPSTGVYEGPVLFIYGTESIFDVGGDEKNIMKLFPNAKLIPVKGAKHGIHGRYRQFEEEIIKLLNKKI